MGAAITVRIGPASRESEIAEILADGTLLIRLAKGRGETNQDLIGFLAKVLKVKAAQIEVVAGLGGSDKLVTIEDLSPSGVDERIEQFRKG